MALAVAEVERVKDAQPDYGRLEELVRKGLVKKGWLESPSDTIPYRRLGLAIKYSHSVVYNIIVKHSRAHREILVALADFFGDPREEWLEAGGYDIASLPYGRGWTTAAMVIRRHPLHRNRQDSYDCMRRVNGSSHRCRARRYLAAPAHEALLRELLRLEGRPWREVHGSTGAGRDGGAHDKSEQARRRTREGLERALAQQRALLRRQAERLLLLDDVGDEERAAFRAVGAEITARIAGLESQLGALGRPASDEQALRQTHRAVIALDVPALVQEARALGTLAPLRDALLATMERAVIVERYPESSARWLRAEVRWNAHIRLLLELGDLVLRAPEAPHRTQF